MRKRKYSYNPAMVLAMILLCLTLISTHLTAGLYARYTTTDTGEDSARVAKFEITETGIFVNTLVAEILPGDSEKRTIEVVNKSEVAVNCTVTLKNVYNNLPIKLLINGAENTCSIPLAPGATGTYNVKFDWPTTGNNLPYIGKVDLIEVQILAEQID